MGDSPWSLHRNQPTNSCTSTPTDPKTRHDYAEPGVKRDVLSTRSGAFCGGRAPYGWEGLFLEAPQSHPEPCEQVKWCLTLAVLAALQDEAQSTSCSSCCFHLPVTRAAALHSTATHARTKDAQTSQGLCPGRTHVNSSIFTAAKRRKQPSVHWGNSG